MTELHDDLDKIDFSRFMRQGPLAHVCADLALARAAEAVKLIDHMGLFSGDYLTEWMAPILQELKVTTFGDLRITDDPGRSLPPEKQYRVVVHASDITRGDLVRLPWDYDFYGLERDGQPVIGAVRASMSHPLLLPAGPGQGQHRRRRGSCPRWGDDDRALRGRERDLGGRRNAGQLSHRRLPPH
jgi:NTE family protein